MAAMSDFLENEVVRGMFRTKTAITWPTSTAVSLGDLVYASTGDGNIYECTSAGTTGGSEPTWNTSLGDTTTDNGATWTTWQPCGQCLKRQLFVALYTAAPSDSGGGTEVTGGAYARKVHDPADANWSDTSGTDGHTDNATAITFVTATASWGTVTHIGIFDKLTGGNLLFHGALTASKAVGNGDTFKFNANDLDLTFA